MNQIEYLIDDSIATIRFNRPEKKNALSLDMYAEFLDAMKRAHADDSVRAVIITGRGDAFTAGNDIANFREQTGREDGGAGEQFMLSFVNSEKPLIAAVNGLAVGVGTTLLLHCDLVYASDSATFKLPFVSLGICSEFASSLTLPAVMGLQKATELLLLADTFTAQKALELGFVNALHKPDQVYAEAMSVARRIAEHPTEAIRTTRTFLRRDLRSLFAQRLREERRAITGLLGSPEAQRAFDEFLTRRTGTVESTAR